MNKKIYSIVSADLEKHCENIPMWGARMNYEDNALVPLSQMKHIYTMDKLEEVMNRNGVPEEKKDFCRRRWFHAWTSWIDEYLFYRIPSVRKNPDEHSPDWDIEFKNGEQYDIKSTKVLARITRSHDIDWILNNPEKIIDSLSANASTTRKNTQDRLYILYYSERGIDQKRIDVMSCKWHIKEYVFKRLADRIDNVEVFNANGHNTVLCYIIENSDGTYDYMFYDRDDM